MINHSPRHAYLILAHRDDLAFRTLIHMLDYPNNDIFIHMDKKTKNYQPANTEQLAKYSHIYHCKRSRVSWGAYSQIKAELSLLELAIQKDHYLYYHLISGQDLPIKTQDYIHSFFNKHQGQEFVRFQNLKFIYEDRIKYYYPFQEIIGKKGPLPLRILNKILLSVQKRLRFNRQHKNQFSEFQKGTNWFSITDNLARHTIKNELWIKKTFKHSHCCDEIFLQTLIHNSQYKNQLYHSSYDNNPSAIMRLIDWRRGKPYTYRISDFNEIKNSDLLFARKFDPSIDSEIIQKVKTTYS